MASADLTRDQLFEIVEAAAAKLEVRGATLTDDERRKALVAAARIAAADDNLAAELFIVLVSGRMQEAMHRMVNFCMAGDAFTAPSQRDDFDDIAEPVAQDGGAAKGQGPRPRDPRRGHTKPPSGGGATSREPTSGGSTPGEPAPDDTTASTASAERVQPNR